MPPRQTGDSPARLRGEMSLTCEAHVPRYLHPVHTYMRRADGHATQFICVASGGAASTD